MTYFHARIDYLDKKIKKNQTEFIYDIEDKQDLKEKILIPYLEKRDLFINGINFEYDSIRSVKIFDSKQDIHSTVELGDSLLGTDTLIYYTKKDILGEDRLAPDITNKIFDDAKAEISSRTSDNKIDITMPIPKEPKLFISHSHSDEKSVESIVELLEFIGLDETNMFCSSIDGYGIPLGEDIFEYLRKLYTDYELMVIFIHSDSYYDSPVSLNEMGAAWVLKKEYYSILLPGFNFEKMSGVVKSDKIAIKLDSQEAKGRLNEFKDKICRFFSLQQKTNNTWERRRDKFLNAILRSNLPNTDAK